ncbi:MAG: hypothetical protein ACKVOR_03095 [Flavobacteriales bacterium]
MTLKQKVHTTCIQLLNEKMLSLQSALNDLRDGIESDGKSTAGDKHETARAMAHIEQEQLAKQLHDVQVQKSALDKINPDTITPQITNGSLVKTDKGYFYLSVALGKVMADSVQVVALSPHSPLGAKWMGAKVNDMIELNKVQYIIEDVC